MIKLLVKKQLTEIFRSYFYDAKKNKARSRASTIGFIVLFVLLMAGLLGGMFTWLSLSLCGDFAAMQLGWLTCWAVSASCWAPSAVCSIPTRACIWPRTMTCC